MAEAVAFAVANESTAPRDLLQDHRRTFGREPHGEAAGVVLRLLAGISR